MCWEPLLEDDCPKFDDNCTKMRGVCSKKAIKGYRKSGIYCNTKVKCHCLVRDIGILPGSPA